MADLKSMSHDNAMSKKNKEIRPFTNVPHKVLKHYNVLT